MADPSGLLNAPVDDEAGRGQLEHQVGAIAALPPGADAGIFDHGEGVEQYAGARHIANQARALTTKSLLVLRRRKKSTAAYVLMPSLAILALWGVIVGTAAWLDPSNSAAHRDYPLAQLTVRKCEVFDAATNLATGAPCTTAMFAPAGTNTVSIMRKFAAATGLEYGTDVVAASSPQAVADAIAQSPGSVDAAVIFTRPDDTLGDAAWAPAGASGTPTLEYQLWTNTTGNMGRWLTGDDRHLLDQAGVYGHYEAVMQAVDAAIIGHISGLDGSADIDVKVGKFAELATGQGTSCLDDSSVGCTPVDLHDLISWMFGDLGLVLGTSFTALMVLYTIASEKEAKMLAALRTVGLREWLFWTSWGVAYFALGILGAALSTTVGSILNLRMFVQCAWFVQFLATLLFVQSFAAQAIFLASFITRGRYIITSSIFLLVLVFAVCGTWKTLAFAGLHYHYGADSDWMTWSLASVQPWFHFMRIEMAILATIYPTAHLRENSLLRVIQNSETRDTHYFSFSHLGNATIYDTIDYRWSPVKSVEYTTGTSLWAMVYLSFFYYWLAWYFGQVSSPDEGSHEGCCFCFSPNYWGVRRKQLLVMDDDDSIGLEKSRSMLDRSVRTYKLSKAYKEEMAVSEVTMEIESSCCLALLGTNGAGKSTFIKTLTGIHPPTHGEAFIFGLDIKADMAKLQNIMGCCPQDDLLWGELTAREHLHLYARFKGITEDALQQHCTDILTAVGLVADADNHVSTYSGGMKRRLSVGIASVSSPTIMFLDEPSTGMDPLSKRRVWTMIEQLKKNRVMLLTTHSMEEAEALGDKVAILDRGRLRAIGSSLFLKRTYGKGHTVSLLSEVDNVPRVEQLVKSSIPSAEILGTDAGNTSVSIKRSAVQGIPRLFSTLMAEDGLIKEWGLSDTTLEEVFLRLAAQNKEVNAEIEGQDGDDVGRVMLVRSSPSDSMSDPELVAVLEASDPSSIVVVGPEGSDLEVLADTGRGDEKRYVCVAPGGTTVHAGVDIGTEECGLISQFDEIVALDEVCLPSGVRRVHCERGWVSATGSDGAEILKVVNDDTVLAMGELVIPDSSSESLPTMQMIDMTVPADAHGQTVRIEIGGKTVEVDIPAGAVPGTRIQVPVPLPQLQEGSGSAQFSDFNSVEAGMGIVQQTFAVVWKNSVLAFGCRKGPGCRGLLTCKCCELFCYISLFAVMAMVAIVHLWVVSFVEGVQREALSADHEYFCADGVMHVTWDAGSGWATVTEATGSRYTQGSYCPYQYDGYCDEPSLCQPGSDLGDCPAVELHSTQFSSCDRAAVAEEMLNLSTRAQVSLPLERSVGELDHLRQRQRQTWTSACNDNDRTRTGGACWVDLVAANSRGLLRHSDQHSGYGGANVAPGSCSLQSVQRNPTCVSGTSSFHCYNLLHAEPGDIINVTGGYPPNLHCSRTLYCASNQIAALTFVSFDTEQGYDFVTVTDPDDPYTGSVAGQVLSRSSGSHLPAPVVATGRHLALEFTTDGSVSRDGFQAIFTCEDRDLTNQPPCAGDRTLAGNQSGVISSGYDNSAECEWHIVCPDVDSTVRLEFDAFSLESNFDYVSVFDGNESYVDPELLHHSGHVPPDAVSTTGRSMVLVLTSDGSVASAGFSAEYQCVGADGTALAPLLQPGPEPEPEPTEQEMPVAPKGPTPSVDPSCVPGGDVWFTTAQTRSGGQSTSFAELSLLPGSGLEWAQQSVGYLTMLSLSDLEDHPTTASEEAIAMRFREVDAGSVNERVLAAQVYNRDHRAQNHGQCTTTAGACPGNEWIGDGGGSFSSDGYADNADCEWLVTCASQGSVVDLTLSSVGTESNYDFVRVYDGDSINQRQLLSLDGSHSVSPSVTSSGSVMMVRLTSDSSATGAGFLAEFQCSSPDSFATDASVQYTYTYTNTNTNTVGNAHGEALGQFSSAEEANAWFRDSFPVFAIEVEESLITDRSVTFRYGVRQWTAHAYQAYPFLATGASSCGRDACRLERDVEYANPSADRCEQSRYESCPRETKADMTLRGIISAVSNSVLRTRLGTRNASLTATIVPMPEFTYWESNRRPNDSLALWLVMYPLLTMLLIPTLASMLASEKEKGLLEMVRMEGGRTTSFLLGNWLFTFAYSLVFNVLFVLTIAFSGAADADSGVHMPGNRVATLVIIWAHAQTGLVHFIGLCLFRKARHAALFGAFSIIIAVMAGFVVTIMEAEHLITPDLFPLSCLLIPPLAYTRTVGELLWYGGGEEFDRGLIMLMFDGLLYLLLAVGYSLRPKEDTRQKLARLVRFMKARVLSTSSTAAELPLVKEDVVSTGGGSPFHSEDGSVIAERERACAELSEATSAIRIKRLVKDYAAVSGGKDVTKRAINELFLSIERNEVFGLLGPNGAGKTTTIQVLTGMTPPSAGSASVCGFDVETEIDLVKRVIGVCPQFDVLWEDMTVRQHLVFYSLLRGLPRARVTVEARRLAEKMELDGDAYNKPASTLSGGAKRRLSIAIALAGRPPCLFFDEPTTGLDPETRRQIWSIIKAERRNNAIVITTHSMEEADALCSRIGIMAGGSLRAVGSQNYLKSRFGDGFKVSLNCVDESRQRLQGVNDFIMSLSDEAQFVSRFGAHLTFTVPLAGGDVAQIFNKMEQSKRELGVAEWGVTQASLEEVFIKVVMQWEEGVHGQSVRNAFVNPVVGFGASSSDDED